MSKQEKQTPPVDSKIAERLFEMRTVLIHGEITSKMARDITAQLLALSGESNDEITIYIHSEGGHVESADSVHDMISFVKPRIKMVGTGWVASAGVHVYLAAPKQDRYCLPNTRFLLHEPRGGVGGQASDVEIQAREIIRMRERLNNIFAAATGQTLEQIKKDTDRDYWMSAEEAKAYGLVGKIVTSHSEIL